MEDTSAEELVMYLSKYNASSFDQFSNSSISQIILYEPVSGTTYVLK